MQALNRLEMMYYMLLYALGEENLDKATLKLYSGYMGQDFLTYYNQHKQEILNQYKKKDQKKYSVLMDTRTLKQNILQH